MPLIASVLCDAMVIQVHDALQGLSSSLTAVSQTVASVPDPAPYLSALDPAVAAYAALPSPPGNVLLAPKSTFDNVVTQLDSVRHGSRRYCTRLSAQTQRWR